MNVVPKILSKTSSVSPKGQVTLPIEIRRMLGLKPKDKVSFEITDGEVKITPARFTLESAFGSVEPATTTDDFDQRIREAKEERAERTMRQLQSS